MRLLKIFTALYSNDISIDKDKCSFEVILFDGNLSSDINLPDFHGWSFVISTDQGIAPRLPLKDAPEQHCLEACFSTQDFILEARKKRHKQQIYHT